MYSTIELTTCFFSLFVLILVGNWKNSTKLNTNIFLIAEQNTGYLSLTATLVMTTTNTGLLLAFSTLGYTVGFWALSLPFVFLVGLIFYSYTVSKHWRESNSITAAHFFVEKFGTRIALISAVILLVAMVGFSATYIKSLALIFKPFFEISIEMISLIITALVLMIVIRGGLKSVIRTDILSFIGISILLVVMVYRIYHIPTNIYSPIKLSHAINTLKPSYIFSLFILTGFSYILSPSYSQKLIAARTPQIAKYSVFTAAILIYIIYACCILICYMLKEKGIKINSSNTVFPEAMHLAFEGGWLGICYGVLFSIGATTLTGVWTAMVSLLTFIFDKRKRYKPGFLTFLCAFSSFVCSICCVDSILEKIVLANIPIVALSFGLLGGIYWSRTSSVGVFASMLTGCLGASWCYWYYGEELMYTWYWAIYVTPLIFFVGIVVSLFTSNNIKKY